jgi:5-methyltetrahydropteroyltriglutamate--homocysteine methyltransferase
MGERAFVHFGGPMRKGDGVGLTVTAIGSYPRPPEEGGEFRLRKTLQAVDRGEATAEDVRAAEDDLTAEILTEQAAAGVDLVTDGQVRWDDPLTRVAEGLDGFAVSGLIRYFDNNTYFRRPVVKGPVRRTAPILVDEFEFAAAHSERPVKAVLCGPYTLAALSADEHYGDRAALLRDLAAALRDEARDLVAAGASVIQFDEPALARVPGQPPGDLDALAGVAPTLVDGVEARTILATYFGDVAPLGAPLFALPFDGFGLDLVSGPQSTELIGGLPGEKVLQAGIADARNTRLESVDDLAAAVGDLAELVSLERLWIAPSCGLEYLPREAAGRKLRRLAEVKERVS